MQAGRDQVPRLSAGISGHSHSANEESPSGKTRRGYPVRLGLRARKGRKPRWSGERRRSRPVASGQTLDL